MRKLLLREVGEARGNLYWDVIKASGGWLWEKCVPVGFATIFGGGIVSLLKSIPAHDWIGFSAIAVGGMGVIAGFFKPRSSDGTVKLTSEQVHSRQRRICERIDTIEKQLNAIHDTTARIRESDFADAAITIVPEVDIASIDDSNYIASSWKWSEFVELADKLTALNYRVKAFNERDRTVFRADEIMRISRQEIPPLTLKLRVEATERAAKD